MANQQYLDELADWVSKQQASRPRQARNVVAFLAVRADVEAALAAGYPKKTIWQHLHETGRLTCRYETFLKHVRKYSGPTPAREPHPPEPASSARGRSQPSSAPRTQEKSKPPTMGSFNFDSSAKKEDLI